MRRSHKTSKVGQAPNQTVFSIGYDFHYGLGDNGNVFSLINYRDSSRMQTFTYDALNRLPRARSKDYSGLSVYLLEPEFAARVTKAIRVTVAGILSGAIRSGIHDQSYGDARTVEQYLGALKQLLEIIPAAKSA